MNKTFAVIFSGQLQDGAKAAQVQANLARLFKVEEARIRPMFSGKPVVIKKDLDESTAGKYRQALLQAGAIVRIVEQTPPSATPPAAQTEPVKTGVDDPARTPAPMAADTKGGILNATLAEAGAILVEPAAVEPLEVDTSRLQLAAVGVTLVEPENTPDLVVDTSALSMAEAGVQLVEPDLVEPLQVDTGKLSLAEPGVTFVEAEEFIPAKIDISHLQLD